MEPSSSIDVRAKNRLLHQTGVLYITYDGLLEPLGQSQVLSYLFCLAEKHRINIISYEKSADWNDHGRRAALQKEIRAAGIVWYPLRYHQRFSIAATAYDVARGIALGRNVARKESIDIAHARSYVGSMIARHLQQRLGVRYIFDMRGFWPDEKVDAGTWSRRSPIYHLAKYAERSFLTSADAVVSLTQAGVDEMRLFDYLDGHDTTFSVIPTCADLERFHAPASRGGGPFTLGYVGNAGGWYRFGPVIAAFQAIRSRQPDARLLIVNQGQHEAIRVQLEAHRVPAENVELVALDFADVPNAMRRMDATAFFITPTFSKRASAPTKLAEFLGCGVPCLVNDGVGDMGRIVREEGVGVVIDKISDEAAAEAAISLMQLACDAAARNRCVDAAHRHFSLARGVEAYDAMYQRLAERVPA
jgi:glycosyltransferase involved in cell wall biosynthesis